MINLLESNNRGSRNGNSSLKKFVATAACGLSLATSALAQGTQPMVAIHDSELTRALETMPASGATPTGSGTTGFQWWTTDWHYFVMPESLKEAFRSDGTAFTVIGDSNITAGLLLANGAPKYPVVISFASEAMRDDEIAPLTNYVAAGGFLVVGGSSFTRTTTGASRGDFALANQMGLHMTIGSLTNWAVNTTLTRQAAHRITSHIPDGPLTWRMPSSSEEISWGISPSHIFAGSHDVWQVNAGDATVIATGDAHPYLTVKPYGKGYFIYDAAFQPMIGHGGFAPGMYTYNIVRKAVEWAFESSKLPVPKLSPWPYQYDAAFMLRHDLEDFANEVADIELSAGFEFTNGVKGDYYFCTGTLRQDMAGTYDTNAVIASIRRAATNFGATIGPHNGGLKNPDNAALLSTDYDYWHWGPDEALDVTPAGYASGKAYAQASLSSAFTDIEGWMSGINSSAMRVWVAPNFNSTREASYDLQSQVGVKIAGDQKLTPFPHWTLSTQTPGKRYNFLSEPVSDWFVGGMVAQSLEPWHPPGVHTSSTLHAAIDYYYNLGALVNLYSHTLSTGEGDAGQLVPDYITYSMNTNLHPRLWSANAISVYNWWLSRSNAQITVASTNLPGDVSRTTFTIKGSVNTNEAVELNLPSTSQISGLQVLANGAIATGKSFPYNGQIIRVLVGTTITNVVISYTLPPQAGDDFYTTPVNTQLVVAAPGVLANDTSGASRGVLTPTLVSGPSHGTLVTGGADGSFTYLPATNFVGTDIMTYQVSDGQANSKVATVLVSVLAPGQLFADSFTRSTNPAPIAPWTAQTGNWSINNGALSGTSDVNAYGNAWVNNTNWTDYTVSGQVQFSSINGLGGGIGGRLNPATGAHYAAWVYPDGSAGGANMLKLIKFEGWQDWSGTPMQAISIPSVGTNAHIVAMTFAGANISITFDGAPVISTTDNNFDGVAPFTNGGVTVDLFTDTNPYVLTFDNVTVSTQITAPPVIANADSYSVIAGNTLNVLTPGVLSNDTGGSNVLTASLVSNVTHGTLTLNANGSFSYVPTNGFSGSDSFSYKATDGGTFSTATATITVNASSTVLLSDDFTSGTLAPWVVQTGTWAATGGRLLGQGAANSYANAYVANSTWTDYSVQAQVQMSATTGYGGGIGGRLNPANGAHYAAWIYPDASAGGAKTLKLVKFEGWTTWSFTPMQSVVLPTVGTNYHTLLMTFQGANITVSFDGTPMINVTDNNFDGVAPFTSGGITADVYTDTHAYGMSIDNVTVSTIAVTIPPVVAANDSYVVMGGTTLNVAAPGVLGNDTGGSGSLTASVLSTVTHGSLALSANGSFIYTPTNGFSGADSFTYQATDGNTTASATVNITVNAAGSLFSDDFTSTADPGPLAPWVAQSGTWSVTGGRLLGLSAANNYGNAYVANSTWTDYSVQAQVQISAATGWGGGIGGRLNPANGAHYAAWIYPDASAGGATTMKLVKFEGWTTWSFTPMQTVALPTVGTNWHTVAMTFQGANISVSFDGTPMINVTDNNYDGVAPFSSGGITADLYTDTHPYGISIDNVVVNTLGTVTAPSITTQPVSRTNNAGTTATFTVAATGTSLNYQWFKNLAVISGATTPTLTLANVTAASAGSYTVTVSNSVGSVTSSPATLTVIVPPAITTQPQSQTNNVGTTATFSVVATGTSPTYQWRFNGANIAGATTSTYSKTNVQATNAGSYTVVITNAAGSITSSAAVLTVFSPSAPSIGTQPVSQTVIAGQNATFSISATGTAPLAYQWRFNGANIAGATAASYTVTNAQPARAGSYSAVVTNIYGSATSSVAVLTVNYSLAASATTGGTVAVTPNQTSFAPNTVVTLKATPSAGFKFTSWSGGATGTNATLTVTMTGNLAITANFAAVVTMADIIVDDAAATYTGTWRTATAANDNGAGYHYANGALLLAATATFKPTIVTAGKYDVYVWCPTDTASSTSVPVTVSYSGGTTSLNLNETTGTGSWKLITSGKTFAKGTTGFVRFSNLTDDLKRVTADAVRLVYSNVQ